MKKFVTNACITIAALVALNTQALAETKFSAGAYQIDTAHSKVGFEIPHLVISTVEGRFSKFDGDIVLAEKFEKSTVKVNIDINSIETSNGKRDEHLKGADFFDVAKYPQMKFEASEVKGTPEAFQATGNLTLHGVTKKVTLDGKYLGTVVDMQGNQKAAFSAKTKINRKDFGLTWNKAVEAGPVVGDDVTIDLRIQAARPTAKK
jgi:polyisoprenoid-binding protein YceI